MLQTAIRARLSRFTLCLVPFVLAGCFGASEPPIPETELVFGTVTLNGEPLPNAMVMFFPSGDTKGIECSGITNESGRFELQHPRGPVGAPAGTYKVVVSHLVDGQGKPIVPNPNIPPADMGAVEALPPKYSSLDETVLSAQIPAAEGDVKLELKK